MRNIHVWERRYRERIYFMVWIARSTWWKLFFVTLIQVCCALAVNCIACFASEVNRMS